MVTLLGYLYQAASVVAWFHQVFMGRQSGGVHNALTVGLAYQLRATAYFLLITETLPPISDQEPATSPSRDPDAGTKKLPSGAKTAGAAAGPRKASAAAKPRKATGSKPRKASASSKAGKPASSARKPRGGSKQS